MSKIGRVAHAIGMTFMTCYALTITARKLTFVFRKDLKGLYVDTIKKLSKSALKLLRYFDTTC